MQQFDVYQVKPFISFLGQKMTNIYWYQLTSIPGNAPAVVAQQLCEEWRDSVWQAHKQWTSQSLHMDGVQAVNWADLDSQNQIVIDEVGQNITDPLPTFVSVTYLSSPPKIGGQYGSKRFPGVCEENIDGNSIQQTLTQFDDLADALAATLVTASGDTFELVLPISAQIPKMGTANVPFSRYISGGAWSYSLGTQYSRKAGVGD